MENFLNPISINHKGKAIYVVSSHDADKDQYMYSYNILNLTLDSKNDQEDWQGYLPLDIPGEVSLAGMNILRVSRDIPAGDKIEVITDQKYVYLVRCYQNSLFINRYLMVEAPNPNIKGSSRYELQPAWEVRFQRSQKPDTPLDSKDTQSYMSLERKNFVEPVIELPFDAQQIDLSTGYFNVQLVPTSNQDELRWQFILGNIADGKLYTYSIKRNEQGWFYFNENQVSSDNKTILPDKKIQLLCDSVATPLVGPPAATVYNKQTAVRTANNEKLKMQTNYRYMLAVQTDLGNDSYGITSLDFAIAKDGTLAFLDDNREEVELPLEVGRVKPVEYTLHFDGVSYLAVDTSNPIILQSQFTMQAWVYPSGDNTQSEMYVFGADCGTEEKDFPPFVSVFNRLQVKVGFGNGELLLTTWTEDNVLTADAWNNIAVFFDNGKYTIYINGDEVALSPDGDSFEGALPTDTPFSCIGGHLSCNENIQSDFIGEIDEVRIWQGVQYDDVKTYLYKEIKENEITENLLGYWRLDEGNGATAFNLSSYENRNAALNGPQWVASSAPVAPSTRAISYVDARGLTLDAGVIIPHSSNDSGFPLFGDMKLGSQPDLLSSYDGLVHLYYEGNNNEFLAAQYDTSISRAVLSLPWEAKGDESEAMHGELLLSARQTGTIMNQSIITIEKTANSLDAVTLDDGVGNSETWNGLIERVDYITNVLSGNYVGDPTDPSIIAEKSVFYDDLGERNVNFLPIGEASLAGYMLFVSRNTVNFVIQSVKVTANSETRLCEATITGLISEDNPELGTFSGAIKNIPTDPSQFISILNGTSATFDYTSPENGADDLTKFYAMHVGKYQLLTIVPDVNVADVTLFIKNAGQKLPNGEPDPSKCDIDITVTLRNGEKVEGTWVDVERDVQSVTSAIKESSEGKNQEVSSYLFFSYPPVASGAYVDNTPADTSGLTLSTLYALLSFLDIFNMNVSGEVESFDLKLDKTQGLSTEGWATTARARGTQTKGSSVFAVYSSEKPDNGYPAVVNFNDQASVTATLKQPGSDGGWLVESPRNAVANNNIRSGIAIPTDTSQISNLELNRSITMEAWVNVNFQNQPERGKPVVFPRIIHANPTSDNAMGSRYMMGLAYSSSLQFLRTAVVQTSDQEVTEASKKLFPNPDNYSIQFYVKADLATPIDAPGKVYTKSAGGGGTPAEDLKINTKGNLIFTNYDAGGATLEYTFVNKLTTQVWTFITIVKSGTDIDFYYENKLDGTLSNVPSSASASNDIILGNNNESRALEMELNLFSIWSKSLSAGDVSSQYQQAINGNSEGLQLLWGMDIYRTDDMVVNSALFTEELYSTSISGDYFWDYPGMFCRAFASVRNTAIETRDALISGNSWNHLAAIYDVHYGVALDLQNYGDCGDDDTLNFQNEFSVATWINRQGNSAENQVIISKFGSATSGQSYELGISPDNKLYFKIKVSGLEDKEGNKVSDNKMNFTLNGNTVIANNEAYFVAATFKLQQYDEEVDNQLDLFHKLSMKLYVNGVEDGSYAPDKKMYGNVNLNASKTPVNIGRTKPDGKTNVQGYFNGQISDLSLWNEYLGNNRIVNIYEGEAVTSNSEGLISFWNFGEQSGRVAFDQKSDNNALFVRSDMWITYHENATYKLLLNGNEIPIVTSHPSSYGGYEKQQYSFASMRNVNDAFKNPFLGKLDEIRVWDDARTNEQVTDNMERYLTGKEKGLSGYWKFDVGTGINIFDQTANGNNGHFDAIEEANLPQWVTSTAPVNNEARGVLNALGGLETAFTAKIDNGPTTVEYADAQYDSDNNLISVLKRAYIYKDVNGCIIQITGYKIGDLRQIFLGQVQSKPSLIGYVEGPPPLPSENLTRPFYEDPTKPSYLAYYDSSSIKLTQQSIGKTTFSGSRQNGSHLGFDIKIGGGYSDQAESGQFIYKQITKIEGKGMVAAGIDWSISETNGSSVSSAISNAESNYMYNCGDWEYPDSNGDYYLATGERRFIPNNEGYALVKSSTADMYTQHLENTGTLVGITIVPNKDIPEDINMIYFPMNTDYVKNGSLDGRLGLQDAPDVSGKSYFKPIEAYALKRMIEKEEKELMSDYVQFNAAKLGKAQNDDLSPYVENNLLYNWEDGVPKKDMVSTYVWTAAGGLYSEKKGYVSQIQENQSGSYNFSWSLGFTADLEIVFNGPGFWTDLSLMGGTNWNVTVEKSKEEETALDLEVNADPDGFLSLYLGKDQSGANIHYSQNAVPGKVDTYRFMSFYLAPKKKNFRDFYDKVVDPFWLQTSSDPRAVALREAMANENASWRLLHRVTYVSRIAPEFQAFPLESQAPPNESPVNEDANLFMLTLVKIRLGEAQNSAYTPAEIGNAVRAVFSEDLLKIIPWWQNFLDEANVINSTAYESYNTLVKDTIAYVIQYFESQN